MPNAQEVLEWMEWKDREKKLKENMTNDEWRRTCSTEEFAKFVEKVMDYGAFCATKDDFSWEYCKECGCPWCVIGFEGWLKKKHEE